MLSCGSIFYGIIAVGRMKLTDGEFHFVCMWLFFVLVWFFSTIYSACCYLSRDQGFLNDENFKHLSPSFTNWGWGNQTSKQSLQAREGKRYRKPDFHILGDINENCLSKDRRIKPRGCYSGNKSLFYFLFSLLMAAITLKLSCYFAVNKKAKKAPFLEIV